LSRRSGYRFFLLLENILKTGGSQYNLRKSSELKTSERNLALAVTVLRSRAIEEPGSKTDTERAVFD